MAKAESRLDQAARAGWLYYVAGNTQDEIAAKLGVSRPSAQRLVSLAISEGLVRVRVEHPIAACLELAAALKKKFDLQFAEVTPADPSSTSTVLGVAEATAVEMERWLKRSEPLLMGVGTGRTLRAAVELLPQIDCAHHQVVSLTGNIAPNGAAAFFNVVFTLSDVVKAPSFPMPLPVIASSVAERDALHAQKGVRRTLELAAAAEVTFIGVGELGDDAPLVKDGFISLDEMRALVAAGAVGEICGWTYAQDGGLIDGMINDRVASAPIPSRDKSLVIGVAMGPRKTPAILGALRGGMINGLITDERTAKAILL